MQKMNQTEFANYVGVDQSLVSRWCNGGKLKGFARKYRNRWNIHRPEEAAEHVRKNLDPGQRKKTHKTEKKQKTTQAQKQRVSESAETNTLDFNTAKTWNERYKAALKKLEYEEKAGELLKKSDVEKDAFNMARVIRDAILNIPDRISAELASITDVHAISEKLTTELTAVLEELSS